MKHAASALEVLVNKSPWLVFLLGWREQVGTFIIFPSRATGSCSPPINTMKELESSVETGMGTRDGQLVTIPTQGDRHRDFSLWATRSGPIWTP